MHGTYIKKLYFSLYQYSGILHIKIKPLFLGLLSVTKSLYRPHSPSSVIKYNLYCQKITEVLIDGGTRFYHESSQRRNGPNLGQLDSCFSTLDGHSTKSVRI